MNEEQHKNTDTRQIPADHCPYCGGPMEDGVIQSPQEINWKRKRHFFGRARFHEGSVVLSRLSFSKGSAVQAYLCRDCRRVIIHYGNITSDLNR